jgi:heme exporter protein B
MITQVAAIVRKDLLVERRNKANINALAFLGVLLLVVVSFALGGRHHLLRLAAPGTLWVIFAFAGMLAFARAYQSEVDNRCFEGMLLAGALPRAIYLGKLVAVTAVMFLVEVATLTVMVLLYAISLTNAFFQIIPILALGTIGFASIGVLYGRLTMNLRAREVLLPLLALPVVIPALLAAVSGTANALDISRSVPTVWLEILIVFDIVFVTAGLLIYPALEGE